MPTTAAEAPVVETARLRLRGFAPRDAADLALSCAAWESVRYTSGIPHPYPAESADAFIESTRKGWVDGTKLIFAVADRETDRHVGQVGLTLDPDATDVAELSYLLTPSVWGRGYAAEMARACIAFGFERRGFSRLFARIFVENEPSIVLARRLGFTWRETGPIDAPARGRAVDVHWYDLDRSDWTAS